MVRTWSAILGVGLAVLWLAGINNVGTTPWVTWLDGLGAICAWVVAAAVTDKSSSGARAGSTGTLSLGLFAMWIVGLSTSVVAWQVWWTFGFACAFGVLAIASYGQGRSSREQISPISKVEQDRFRKSA